MLKYKGIKSVEELEPESIVSEDYFGGYLFNGTRTSVLEDRKEESLFDILRNEL